MSILECKGLSKRFGAVTALDGISFTIEPGRIVGLLGPNGSGKTTLIKLANGLLVPTAGELWINGRAPGKESHAMVSYLPERTSLPLWMTVKQLQDFYEDFYADFQRERSEEMLDRLEISAKQRMKHMSKGTREKVQLILAILRFRSNLMADEGYVMFTLPVSTHTLVWSKLIVSAVWFLGAVVVDVLSLLALVANVEMFWELGRVFQEIADQWNAYYVGNGVAFLVECLLLFLVFCVVACLEFYTPLAIGHSFAQHKMLLSVAFFFAIQVVTQIVSGMLLFAGVPMLDSMDGWLNSLTPATAIHGFMWGSILISAIYGAILYCITIRMLHRHLNLE